MFGFKERKKKRIYSIPENHSVIVFRLMPAPPLTNVFYFDMVDVEGWPLKKELRLKTWTKFWTTMWVESRLWSEYYYLSTNSSSSPEGFEDIRDRYFNT